MSDSRVTGLYEYQRASVRTLPANLSEKDLITNMAMGLSGEVGEVLEILKKHFYHNKPLDKARAAEEIGDVLFYVAGLATALGLDLESIARVNVDKLEKRYPNGFQPPQPETPSPPRQPRPLYPDLWPSPRFPQPSHPDLAPPGPTIPPWVTYEVRQTTGTPPPKWETTSITHGSEE